MKKLTTFLLILVAFTASAQFGNINQANRWDASWICVPDTKENTAGLYLFRKTLSLETVPQTFEVHVSADNGYKLYVNRMLVSLGPAQGDM